MKEVHITITTNYKIHPYHYTHIHITYIHTYVRIKKLYIYIYNMLDVARQQPCIRVVCKYP